MKVYKIRVITKYLAAQNSSDECLTIHTSLAIAGVLTTGRLHATASNARPTAFVRSQAICSYPGHVILGGRKEKNLLS